MRDGDLLMAATWAQPDHKNSYRTVPWPAWARHRGIMGSDEQEHDGAEGGGDRIREQRKVR